MIGPDTIQANREAPVRLASPPRTIRGGDIRATHTHRRPDGQGVEKVTLEIVLEGGDMVLLDEAAWTFLAETYVSLQPPREREPQGWDLL